MLNPRWQKIWSDLWANKVRTLLVILSIAAGVFGIGLILNTQAILSNNLARGFAAVNPASAILVTDSFDDELVKAIRRMPEIAEAEGWRQLTVRLQLGPAEWLDLDLYAIADYADMRVNKIQPEQGAWPPPKHQLLLERSSLQVDSLSMLKIGDTLTLQTPDDKLRSVGLAGLAFDFNQTPVAGANKAYGYITLDTLEWLGQPRHFNELSFTVAENKLDEAYIRQVADRVKDKVEKNGGTIYTTVVPPPGEHPLNDPLSAMLWLMGTLGAISLLTSGFLVVNMMSALLAQQIRQIGLMKAIGARSDQLMSLYFALVLIFSGLGLLIAMPAGIFGSRLLVNFMATMLNLNLTDFQLPHQIIIAQAAIGLFVPFLATLYSIQTGINITVRQAISDYGLNQESASSNRLDRLMERTRSLPRSFLLAWRNLFRHKRRLGLTLITLSLSGAIFMAVASVRTSLLQSLDDSFAYRQYDLMVEFNRPYRIDRIEREALQIPGLAKIEFFSSSNSVSRQRANGSESDDFLLFALSAQTELFRPPLTQGRWLLPQDRNAIIVNTALIRDEPDLKLGDSLVLNLKQRETWGGVETSQKRETTWQIVGIFDEGLTNARVYVNKLYYASLTGSTGRASSVWVATAQRDPEFAARVAHSLEQQFEQVGLRVKTLQTTNDRYIATAFHFNIITSILLIMAVLLAGVGGLGLMGTMSINVIERTREIGIMRAIGASNGAIFQIFITEGLLMGLLSWPMGCLLALPLSHYLSEVVGAKLLKTPLDYTFSGESVLLWLMIVIAIAFLATLWPAWNALRLRVNQILAYN